MADGLINVGILKPELASSFATGFQQAEAQRNALAQQEQQRKLGDLQIANALREQRMAGEEEAAYKAAGNNLANLQTELMQRGLGKQAIAVGSQLQQQQANKIKMLKDTTELMKTEAGAIFANPTLENAVARVQSFGQRTGQDVSSTMQEVLALGNDPVKLKQWAAGLSMTADKLLPKFEKINAGGQVIIGASNPITGAFEQGGKIQKTATPGEIMADARARQRLAAETETGQYSPETIDFLAQQYAYTGQLPPLGIGKKAGEVKMQILDRARQITTGAAAPATPGAEPGPAKTNAEAAQSIASAKQERAKEQSTLRDFSSGMSARRVTANNTAINHLETMDKLAGDLANMDTRVFNRAANTLAKELGSAPPANFDAAKQLVASEVIKAVVQNGGGVTERQEAAENFARANSPEQLRGVINTYRELLGGQLQSLEKQYEVGTNRKDFKQRLTPNTRKVLEHGAGTGQTATGKWEVVR